MLSIIASDPAVDIDVQLWAGAVRANGGLVSSARRRLVGRLVVALKAAGIWSLDDDLWMLVAENSIQALTSLKQRRLATATNSPTFAVDAGYTFDGSTNYLDTGFVPSTHAVAMAASTVRIAAYQRSNLVSSNYTAGVNSTSNRNLRVRPRSATTTATIEPNTTGGAFTIPSADARGYTAGSRSDATAATMRGFKNGVALTRTADPSGYGASLPPASLYIGAGNNGSGTATQFLAATIGLLAVGAPLTDQQELAEYSAVQAHMTALGAAV